MHYLVPPYALAALLFLVLYTSRRESYARAGLLYVVAVVTILLTVAIWWRPVTGDSWRYMEYFRALRGMSLAQALVYREPDPLYALLNWSIGRFGGSPVILFGATLFIYFGVFLAALRRIVSPVDVLVLLMWYAVFPFFVAYAANGLRQGLSLVFLLMGYAAIITKNKRGWIWAFAAPLWHFGAWLAVVVLILHQLMCHFVQPRLRWIIVLGTWGATVLLSLAGINEDLIAYLPQAVDVRQSHDIYFHDPTEYDYRAGFRLDFFVFSIIPLASAFALGAKAWSFEDNGPGWWLSLYLSLNAVYHLFSSVPYADRFAAFSWFLIPLIVLLQVRHLYSRNLMTIFVAGFCGMNLLMLQFYTGGFIQVPRIW